MMLHDLEHLHENDPRSKRLRKVQRTVFSAFTLLFLMGGGTSLLGLQQEKNMEQAVVLAGESREALRRGDPVTAAELASAALPEELTLLNPVYVPEAQRALANALGVYDLADGFRATNAAELPSEAPKVQLSPAGTRLCALSAWELSVFDTESGEKLAALPIEELAAGNRSLRWSIWSRSVQSAAWKGRRGTVCRWTKAASIFRRTICSSALTRKH